MIRSASTKQRFGFRREIVIGERDGQGCISSRLDASASRQDYISNNLECLPHIANNLKKEQFISAIQFRKIGWEVPNG
jgi:hypothetical protein